MEVLKPLSSTNTRRLQRRSRKPATATSPSSPPRAQRLSSTFFDRPSAIGQAVAIALPAVEVETASPNSSSKASRCSSRVRSSLASSCCVAASVGASPLSWRACQGSAWARHPRSLDVSLAKALAMVGTDTEKVFATSSLWAYRRRRLRAPSISDPSNTASCLEANTWINTYRCRCESGCTCTRASSPVFSQVLYLPVYLIQRSPNAGFQPCSPVVGQIAGKPPRFFQEYAHVP